MVKPTTAVVARANQFQTSAPNRTLRQWQALVESYEACPWSDFLDEDYMAACLVRDRKAAVAV